ncbi:MAG: flagellar hook-associated protein FlgL, partial [Clostridiales bacterium]|nr:flagellar hook-associated protein FlgL [Clostridiales bacterium]
MMINNMLRNLNRTMLRLDKRQMQGYTGKRIHKASDDPVATSRVLKTKADISQLKQYQKNVDDAVSWLENTESSVENINKAVHRIRDIAVQAANGVLTAEETQKINEEIKQLKEQIISLGNTTYGSSYIFSGKKIDQPLLDQFGNYNVDLKDYINTHIVDDKKNIQVGSRENIGVNTLGFEIFEGFEKPVIYSNMVGNNDIVLTLPNGEEIDTKTSNPEKALEKLKEMS